MRKRGKVDYVEGKGLLRKREKKLPGKDERIFLKIGVYLKEDDVRTSIRMDNNFLKVYSDKNNVYLGFVLDGLEEQNIRYEVLALELIGELNIAKVPFNLVVELDQNNVELKSSDFKGLVNFKVTISNKKIAKEFGLDVGRYIKKIPLKGDWYE